MAAWPLFIIDKNGTMLYNNRYEAFALAAPGR